MAILCQDIIYRKGMFYMFLIYKYTNSKNGKIYIGQTSLTLEERAQSNGSNYKQCPRFYNAIKEFGWSAFIPEVLEEVETQQEAYAREVYYIDLYNSTNKNIGYNVEIGGKCGATSNDTKKIISEKAKERYIDKTSNPMYGKKHTQESLKKMSEIKMGENNPMYGKTWTEKQRECCGTRGKTLNLSEERREEMREHARQLGLETGLKAVRCIEDNLIFSSITKAAQAYGVAISTLSGHLHNRQPKCAGKHFEFVIM